MIQKFSQVFVFCGAFIVSLGAPVCLAAEREKIDFEDFSFSVPESFTEFELPKSEGDIKMRLWVGEELDENFYPAFSVTYKPAKISPEKEEAFEALRGFMSSLKEQRSDWKQSKIELIKRERATFARCTWEGKHVKTGVAMRGVVATATKDGARVYLSAQSLKDDPNDFLKKCQQTILTVERKKVAD